MLPEANLPPPAGGRRSARRLPSENPSGPLLAADEPAPYRVINPRGRAAMLLTCDHASHLVPRSLSNLGLRRRDRRRHIGWDPGAEDVTRRLARRFGATAILSSYSRLVIDCNRRPGAVTSIPVASDGTPIPANAGLTAAAAARRVEALFRPYHRAVAEALDELAGRFGQPAFVAIHSFTPALGGVNRPWHFGVLWDRDPRLAVPLIQALRSHPNLVVGDNQPYSGRDHFDFSQGHHATRRGLPSALVEIRSDLIGDERGAARHARLLGDALTTALAGLDLNALPFRR